jgi:hypothetical protein
MPFSKKLISNNILGGNFMPRTVTNMEGHYIYNYIAPDKEGVQVY